MRLRFNRQSIMFNMFVSTRFFHAVEGVLDNFTELNRLVISDLLGHSGSYVGFATDRKGLPKDIVGFVETGAPGRPYHEVTLPPEIHERAWRYLNMRLANMGYTCGTRGSLLRPDEL